MHALIDGDGQGLNVVLGAGPLKLRSIDSVDGVSDDSDCRRDEYGCSGDIPERVVFLIDVLPLQLFFGRVDHFEEGYLKDDPIRIILAVAISKIELRQVPKSHDRKYPKVIDDPLHRIDLRIFDSLEATAEVNILWGCMPYILIVL